MRKNSIKNTRINNEVHKELSNIIRSEIKDPRINPMTSVVAVNVSPDLKTCKAYISVLGDVESQQDTIKGLKSAEGYIRNLLAKNINLRNTPEITFVLDQSIEYGVNMSRLIDEVNGKKEVLAINIKEEVVDPDDVEMLEDLVLSAVNEALKKADEETSNKMGKLTGGLNIPGMF